MKNIDLQNRCAVITGEAQGMGLVRGAMALFFGNFLYRRENLRSELQSPELLKRL